MKLVTAAEMRSLEAAANARGWSYAEMLETAGRRVAEAIVQRYPQARAILMLIGPGNNGGDGLVAARWLQAWGRPTRTYLWRRALAADPHLAALRVRGACPLSAAEDPDQSALRAALADCDLVVDALLGTGARLPLSQDLRAILGCVQQRLAEPDDERVAPLRPPTAWPAPARIARPCVVAVDLPTGLDADTGALDPAAVHADLTVTFAHPKRGQMLFPGAGHVGELLVAEIGLPSELSAALPVDVAVPEYVARLLPRRALGGHKGTFGRALILAGSAQYIGAPRLAALAAYRVGAGLVTLALPRTIRDVVAAALTEPTFLPLPDADGALTPEALEPLSHAWAGCGALLVGPGLGQHERTGDLLAMLLDRLSAMGEAAPPLALDADGLNWMAQRRELLGHLPPGSILTPHPGEMARLLGKSVAEIEADRIGVAQRAAQDWRCTVILKGAYTIITSPGGPTTVLPFANPALASGGTGDVLAGAVAGFLAQGLSLSPHHAAVCAGYVHGLAAEQWRQEHGEAGLLAGDLLPRLPDALRTLRGALPLE